MYCLYQLSRKQRHYLDYLSTKKTVTIFETIFNRSRSECSRHGIRIKTQLIKILLIKHWECLQNNYMIIKNVVCERVTSNSVISPISVSFKSEQNYSSYEYITKLFEWVQVYWKWLFSEYNQKANTNHIISCNLASVCYNIRILFSFIKLTEIFVVRNNCIYSV